MNATIATRVLLLCISLFSHTSTAAAAAAAAAGTNDICDVLAGSVILAQDSKNTFLGKISRSSDQQSIFNVYGTYGNEFNGSSIWNEFSEFGNMFNSLSPFNEYSTSPPMIIKSRKIIAYLTTNKSAKGGISPNLLKALCKDELG